MLLRVVSANRFIHGLRAMANFSFTVENLRFFTRVRESDGKASSDDNGSFFLLASASCAFSTGSFYS